MASPSLNGLQTLLNQFNGPGHVLSCYADLRGADGFRHDWDGPVGIKADAIRTQIGDNETSPARQEFEQNLAAVRRRLEDSVSSEDRWIAVFSAKERGFLEALPIDVPLATELVWHQAPYLVPLLTAMLRRREYLVVLTDSQRGQLYAATPGSVRLVDEINAEVPRKQHSVGERWGQAQATIARRRDDAVHHYEKALVDQVQAAFAQYPYSGIILLGQHDILEEVRDLLPPQLRALVKREEAESWYERPAEVDADIMAIAKSVSDADESSTIAGAWDRLTERRAVATGPREVLATVQSGRISPRGHGFLLLGPDPREAVSRCTRCGTLAVDAPATCPRCQGPCTEGNLWEELLLMAMRHKMAVHFVDDPNRLAPYGGMAAFLPKPA